MLRPDRTTVGFKNPCMLLNLPNKRKNVEHATTALQSTN